MAVPYPVISEVSTQTIESMTAQIERARSEGRRYVYFMTVDKTVKNLIHKNFNSRNHYVTQSTVCKRGYWDVVVEILPE